MKAKPSKSLLKADIITCKNVLKQIRNKDAAKMLKLRIKRTEKKLNKLYPESVAIKKQSL
jgi:hypothetical protein